MDGVVLLGNAPMLKTGYSNQLRLMGEALVSRGYRVAHVCDFGYTGHMFELNQVEVYGCDEYPGTLTSTTLKKHILDWRKRHRIERWCLIGLGNLHNWGELVASIENTLLIAPVDGDGIKTEDLPALMSASRVAGMTPHGVDALTMQGFEHVFYLPHGYNPRLLKGRGHRAARATATFSKATGCFLVGFLGDMTIRKAPKQNLHAFARFAQGKDDVRLWLKDSSHPQAEDISQYIGTLPYGTVLSTSTYDNERALSDAEMRDLLVSLDALLHCSSQEGFGIYQIEAQAVGTPVITTAHGSTRHLNAHLDLMVVPKETRLASGIEHKIPDEDEIVVRLESLYQEWKTMAINKRSPICIDWAKEWAFDTPAVAGRLFAAVEEMLESSHSNKDQPEVKLHPPRRRKKIAFLSTFKTACGIATYTEMLASELVNQGESVVVLAEATEDSPIGDYQLDEKIPYIRCWDRKYDAAGALRDVLKAQRPDVVHIQHEWSLFRNTRDLWEVLRESGCKVVFTYHTPDFISDYHEGALSHLMAHSSFADAIITHNEFVCSAIRGKVFPPVAHIDHGIKTHHPVEGSRKQTGIPEGVPMILNYGYASESKGTLDFIRAMEIVKKDSLPYFEAVIYAGTHPHWDVDPYLRECEKIAERVPGLTFIREFLEEDKLDLMLDATDFVCFPYSGVPGHEILSTSGAVMRSLGSGKPIIATDEGRLRDIVGGVHGFKASKNNPSSLALAVKKAIQCFTGDQKTYESMSHEVAILASSRTWAAIAHKHRRLYDRVCSVYSIRPDKVMPITPVWVEKNAKDMLDYEQVQSSQGEEE